ncbi:MAG: cytochrome b N-terminal domain-containing protein [Thermodesulfobacteriota bacterium]
MGRSRAFLAERLGWERHLKPFLEKPLTGDLNWSFTLGGVSALLFGVQALTGMILAMYYNPSADHAYQSIDYIMREVSGGRILRGIHHWGAGAMVILVFVHMVTNFFHGAYKAPREMTWIAGVGLLVLTLAFGFTGYLLPWDQKAYWATVVGTNVASDVPVVGKLLMRLLRGGEEVSGLTLTRFYALHMLVLSALTALLAAVHIYLVRVHDVAGHWNPEHPGKNRTVRFYPEHVFKTAISFAAVFCVILLMAVFVDPPREARALTPDPTYLPRPEWYYMWLFKLLTYFSGQAEVIGSLVIPTAAVLLLAAVPFLSRVSLRSPWERPLAIAVGVTCLAGLWYLTSMGLADSRPYGHVVVVPDRTLSPNEAAGVRVWAERECAYCHHVLGRGGRREGPDLSNLKAKHRDRDYILRVIRDPQTVSRWSIMPRYDLTEAQSGALADYLLSLDFERYGVKIVQKEDVKQGKAQ